MFFAYAHDVNGEIIENIVDREPLLWEAIEKSLDWYKRYAHEEGNHISTAIRVVDEATGMTVWMIHPVTNNEWRKWLAGW